MKVIELDDASVVVLDFDEWSSIRLALSEVVDRDTKAGITRLSVQFERAQLARRLLAQFEGRAAD